MRVIFALAALFALTSVPARAADDCRLQLAASLPMTIDSTGRITVPMSISGTAVNMLVDTGAPASFLTQASAQKLKLVVNRQYGPPTAEFYGGHEITQFTRAQNVALAQMKADSMPFGIMPEAMPSDEEGLLGQDILRAYDLDFDFAGGKLNFYSTDHCAGAVVYWTNDPVAVVPFTRDRSGHVEVDTQLDGKDMKAIFDTGASRTRGAWEVVSDAFGLTPASPGVKKERGDGLTALYAYPFKTLAFGGITVQNPDVTLAAVGVSRLRYEQPPLIVGINVMRRFHLYIANAENKLYITTASAH